MRLAPHLQSSPLSIETKNLRLRLITLCALACDCVLNNQQRCSKGKYYLQEVNIIQLYTRSSPMSSLLTEHDLRSYLSITSSIDHILGLVRTIGRRNILAAEARQHPSVCTSQLLRAYISIHLAITAKVLLALCIRASIARRINLASKTGLHRLFNILEDIAFSNNLRTRIGFKCMTTVGVEVVVHSVQDGVSSDLGGATRCVVDVVALQRDHVVAAGEVHAPIVVGVAGGGPGSRAIDLAVGDCDAVAGAVAEDDVLTGDEVGCDVVDPDHVSYEGVRDRNC